MPALDGSWATARRYSNYKSTWDPLVYTEDGSGLLSINAVQPTSNLTYSGGTGTPARGEGANLNNRPPGAIEAKICEGKHDPAASFQIDLGSTATLTSTNQIYVWGWNSRCEVTCKWTSGRQWQSGGWQTEGHDNTGEYPIPMCGGASELHVRGGGHCGGCWVHGDVIRAQWRPAAVPPYPPSLAPTPPPPWPPAPASVAAGSGFSLWTIWPIFVCLVLMCNKKHGRHRRRGNGNRAPPPRPRLPAQTATQRAATSSTAVPRASSSSSAAATSMPVAVGTVVAADAVSATATDAAVVTGVLVPQEGGAVEGIEMQAVTVVSAEPPAVSGEMTIAAKVEVLRRQLGIEGTATMAEVVGRATHELGIAEEVNGAPLARKVDAALAALRGNPALNRA